MNINKVNIVKGDTEVKINKKLWSLIFGCLIAGSFVWLISFGNSAPAPDFLHSYPHFILDFYPAIITAVMASIITLTVMVLMAKSFSVCASDHPFWLIIPSVTFVGITFFASKLMLASMLSAALPALFIMGLTAVTFRLININKQT